MAVLLFVLSGTPGVAAAGDEATADPVELRLRVTDAVPADDATRVEAGVALAARRPVAPYLGVVGMSQPRPDRSAGIATVDVERMDLDAMAGLRFTTGRTGALHLVLKLAGATLDEQNRLGTRLHGGLADLGLSYSVSF